MEEKGKIIISDGHIEVSEIIKKSTIKPLGSILEEAGLITSAQIQVALQDQLINQELRLGEILAIRGWIKQETADFFAEQWSKLLKDSRKQPIGYYLESAGLLRKEQIQQILKEQTLMGVKFGAIAVLKGWIKEETLEFFLESLKPGTTKDSSFMAKKPTHKPKTPKIQATNHVIDSTQILIAQAVNEVVSNKDLKKIIVKNY